MLSQAQTFHLKDKDTLPGLRVRLKNPDSTPHDLTGATSVTLHVRIKATGEIFSRPMTIEDVTGGIVIYAWQAEDWTDTTTALEVGLHQMEYEVLGPGAARLTFPNAGHDELSVIDDLGQQT